MPVTELYTFNLICENLLAALYGVALVVDSLPENEKIVSKANEDKEKYFYNMFSGDDTYANTESETIEQHV